MKKNFQVKKNGFLIMKVDQENRECLNSKANCARIDRWRRRDNDLNDELYFLHIVSPGLAGLLFDLGYATDVVLSNNNNILDRIMLLWKKEPSVT